MTLESPLPRRILVAGATNVGKTCLLAAFERAVLQNPVRGPRLSLFPGRSSDDPDTVIPPATDLFLNKAAEFFLRGVPFDATLSPAGFEFSLGFQDKSSEMVDVYQFADAPGEFTSPSLASVPEQRRQFIEACRKGYALVYCFEALPEEDPAGRLVNLELNLTRLLTNLTMASGRLNLTRMLFLLTKIDIPVAVFCDRMERRGHLCPLSPMQLAQRLDPLEQMRSIVGSETIAKFLAQNSESDLGVGICSAFGFDRETGQPMVSPYSGLPRRRPDETPEEHYRRWAPFGVREMLLFLAGGDGSPYVKRIGPADADVDDQIHVSYLSHGSRHERL